MNNTSLTLNYDSKILVVDDDRICIKTMKYFLAKNGFRNILTADSGFQALEKLQNETFDLILLDIIMNNMDGYELCKRIKSNVNTAHIPVLMVTGENKNNEDVIKESFQSGAVDFITKPINAIELLSRVKSALMTKLIYDEMTKELVRRKKVEIELKAKEQQASKIIEKNADGIIIVDQKGIILFVNPAAEILFAQKASFLIGNSFGFPLVEKETTEIKIFRVKQGLAVAEMSVVPMIWENQKAYLASLRDISVRKKTEENLQKSLENLKRTLKSTIDAMAMTVEVRDPYTAGHQQRVAKIAAIIAKELGFSVQEIENIQMASVVHDLGKIVVPAEILSKPGKISEPEFSIIMQHPKIGYDILKKIEFPWHLAEIVYQHHEKLNGSGYPRGLSGEEILFESRIITVADVLEAMASHRPYRPALGIKAAMDEINKNKGKLYDETVVKACNNVVQANRIMFD